MKRPVVLFFLTFTLLFTWPLPSHAAVSVTRAELSGSNLRLEGENAVENATIRVDGVQRGRADDDGEFRIEVSGFSSPTCRVSVDDGTGAVTATLSGCTPATTNPEPTPVTASAMSLTPTSVEGGGTSTATVTLSGAAPAGGAQVTLSSSNTSVATVPTSVTVPAGALSTTATVSTQPVTAASSATISATYGGAIRTATLTVNPPPQPEPTPVTASIVSLTPSSVEGGGTSTATVTLSGPAPAGGAQVALSSSNTSVATVPATVTVPGGFRSTTATVSTTRVTAASSATISATYGGATRTATLTVSPPPASSVALSGLTVSPATAVAGSTAQGVVTLTGPAPSGGALVSLFSSNTGIARVPPDVLVPAGATSASFTVTAANASTQSATITATYGGAQRSVTFTVTAAEAGQSLDTLTISPDTVIGGQGSDGRVAFTAQVATDTVVSLSSSNTALATVPANVTVPAGSAFVHFTITTQQVTAPASVTITATEGGVQRSGTLSLTPPPADAPQVTSVTFSPASLEGGNGATGTVTLAAPSPDGTLVHLTSSHPALVQVPAELVFNPGSSSEAFAVSTSTATADVQVTITATPGCCGGNGAGSGVLNVIRTSTPPQIDTVQFERVEWRRCIFSVEATGSNPDAILTVHLASSGSEVLELTNLGGGEWEGERAFRPNGDGQAVTFELRSNFGGTDLISVVPRQGGACRAGL